jgi:hypothetical protein
MGLIQAQNSMLTRFEVYCVQHETVDAIDNYSTSCTPVCQDSS